MKINEQFLLVIGAIIILIAGFFIYIGLSDKKQDERTELNSTIKIEDIIKEHDDWVKESQERTNASSLLPKDVFLRDIQQIPGTDGLYLGLYVDKFTIDINKTDESVPYMICPEQNYGAVSITGDYYIFVMNNDKIIDKLLIPQSDSGLEYGSTSTSITLTLKNTKINNFYLYNEPEPTEQESGDIIRVNLIKFNDYTNDDKSHEFNLLGYYLSCGHNEYLIAGYNSKNNKAIIYPIINDEEKYYWGDNFIPNGNTINYELKCGDHGSEININMVYKYDDKLSGYKLINKSKRACTQEDYTFDDGDRLGINDTSGNIGMETGLNRYPRLTWKTKNIYEKGNDPKINPDYPNFPDIDINMDYPQFDGGSFTASLNKYITNIIQDNIRKDKQDQDRYSNELDYNGWYFINIRSSYRIVDVSNGILSLELVITDFSGGGNGNHDRPIAINWDLKNNHLMEDSNIFCKFNYEQKLSPIIRKYIMRGEGKLYDSFITSDDEMDLFETNESFLIKEDGIIVIFPPYDIAAGVNGTIRIFIPKEEIENLLCKI